MLQNSVWLALVRTMCPAESTLGEVEARESRRPHTFFAGKLVFRDGSQSFACVIRELSDHGARIELPASRLIPRRLFLLSSKKPVAYDAEVVWRIESLAGLKLHSSEDLTMCSNPALQFLKPLSAGLCSLSGGWP